MRTTLAVVILLLLSATGMQAMDPPVIEWAILYPNRLLDVIESFQGNFVCSGWELSSGNYECVFCYNKDGNTLWEYSDPTHPKIYSSHSLLQLADSNFIAVGSGLVTASSTQSAVALSMLSTNGENIWTKVYESCNGSSYAINIALLPDGGFVICGEIDPAEGMNQAWVLRTDSQGDTLWTREWGWEYNDRAVTALYIENGLTVLMHGNTPTTPGGPHLVRYDMDGNMLWETAIDFPGPGPAPYAQAMCEASNGGYLVMDNYVPLIVHTDYSGNYQWSFYPPGAGNNYGWSVNTTMDGGILFGGENKWSEPFDSDPCGMISRHDYQGNELWRDYVYNSGCQAIYSVRQLSQGGYIAVGEAFNTTDVINGILIKYAPETGIESEEISPSVKITNVSPNPFSSTLSITCNLPSPMNASLTVYDLGGRIIDVVETGFFPSGEQTVQWVPSAELASGCYLIRLQTDTGNDVRNCVLLGE